MYNFDPQSKNKFTFLLVLCKHDFVSIQLSYKNNQDANQMSKKDEKFMHQEQ